ncbi:hypothetical protein SNEBB_007022 [Seison nebaliae]|nr:hypothetical protein SNEBB_007022 [Seison nebaliae]
MNKIVYFNILLILTSCLYTTNAISCNFCYGFRCPSKTTRTVNCSSDCSFKRVLGYKMLNCASGKCHYDASKIPIVGWLLSYVYTQKCCGVDLCNDGH